MKTKILQWQSHIFSREEMPKVGSNHTCLAVVMIDSALKREENYYLQVFLKEGKYIEKEVIRHITEDIEVLSSDSDEE